LLFKSWCERVKFSGSKVEFEAASFDLLIDAVESPTKRGSGSRSGVEDIGEFGAKESGMGAGEEQRYAQALGSEVIAMGSGDTADETVQAKAAKVVGHSARGICGWVEAQQLSQVLAQLAMAKPLRCGLNMTKAENSACTRRSSKRRAEAR
jgi:hypothetical protein